MPYKFKVRARNIYGVSDAFSLEVIFTPVNEPATMEPVSTQLSYPNIVLTFVEPDDSGLTVLDYEIVFFDKSQNGYRSVAALCDGTDPDTITALSCTFSIADVISNLGYSRGDLLLAKARARNDEGYG